MDFPTFLIQLLNAVQYGLLLFLVASGLTLIFGIMGIINLAHGSFYMIGAYLAWSLSGRLGNFWVAIALGIVLTVLLGMLLGPIIEVNFHRSLGIGFGSYGIFLTRPLVPVLLLLTLLAMVGPYVWPLIRRPKTRDNLASREETIQDTDPGVQRVEVALLALASLLFGVTLWYSRNYGSSTRLFPSIVAVAGLVLLARRVMLLITSRRPSRGRSESRSPSGISPIVAAVSLVGYVLLFRFLGLVLASAFFVAGMAGLARYPLRTAVMVSAGTAVFLVLFSRIFRL